MKLARVSSDHADFSAWSRFLGPRHLVPIAVALLLCATVYAGTVGVLYLQNQMWTVPLSEIGSGAHDPKDLVHPRGDEVLIGFLAIFLAPLVSGLAVAITGIDVVYSVREGRSRRQMAPAAAVLVLAVVVLLGFLAAGPLSTWYLD